MRRKTIGVSFVRLCPAFVAPGGCSACVAEEGWFALQQLVSEPQGSGPWCAADGGCGGTAWWCSGHGGAARRPRRSCVVAQEPRWRGMAAAWRSCAATEAVAAPCDGHGSSDQHEHGGDRRVCAFRLFRVSPAEKKLGVCRRGRRPRPGHAGPAVLIASARGHGHELGRVERGDERVRGRTRSSCSRRPRCLRQCAACA